MKLVFSTTLCISVDPQRPVFQQTFTFDQSKLTFAFTYAATSSIFRTMRSSPGFMTFRIPRSKNGFSANLLKSVICNNKIIPFPQSKLHGIKSSRENTSAIGQNFLWLEVMTPAFFANAGNRGWSTSLRKVTVSMDACPEIGIVQ